MSILKRILVVLFIFLIIIVIGSLFLPASLSLSRNVFFEADTKVVNQHISSFTFDNQLADFPIKNEDVKYAVQDAADGVNVRFDIQINFGFNPITKFKGVFAEGKINVVLDDKINQLKVFIEDLPKIHKVNVQKVHRSEVLWFLSIRDTVNQLKMSNIHGKLIDEIQHYLTTHQMEEMASPIVIYHYWSDSIIDIEAGIPIVEMHPIENNRIKLNKIDTGFYVTATHYGPYERLPETYFGINEWMRKNQVAVIGSPWEMYITDPSTESNPEKWETIINFPIK